MSKEIDLTNYTPLNGRIIVAQDAAPKFYKTGQKVGLEIPEPDRQKPNIGTVKKLAPTIEQDIEEEDRVLFRMGGGFPIVIDGTELLLLHEAEFFLKWGKTDTNAEFNFTPKPADNRAKRV